MEGNEVIPSQSTQQYQIHTRTPAHLHTHTDTPHVGSKVHRTSPSMLIQKSRKWPIKWLIGRKARASGSPSSCNSNEGKSANSNDHHSANVDHPRIVLCITSLVSVVLFFIYFRWWQCLLSNEREGKQQDRLGVPNAVCSSSATLGSVEERTGRCLLGCDLRGSSAFRLTVPFSAFFVAVFQLQREEPAHSLRTRESTARKAGPAYEKGSMFASALQKRKAQAQQPPQARPQQTKEAGSAPQWKRAKQIAEEVHGASAAWSLSEMLSKKQSTAATPTTAATNAEPKDKLSTTRSWSKPSEQQKPATTGGWKKTAATKARAVASKTVGKQQQQGDEQEGVVFELSAKRRVTVRRWRAAVLIDIREYYDDNGVSKPGKKGNCMQCTGRHANRSLRRRCSD